MERHDESTPLIVERKISLSTKIAYALGHIFNDLTAAMWFSYTLIYLQRIALLEPIIAGALLFLGQFVDALMTPVFGILVDRYSKKKTWHVVGSILVAFSFPGIFGSFVDVRSPAAMIVYVTSITIFQTGWAAVQISHLSMIPALTNSSLARADLTAIRYSAQVGAAVVVFIVTWIVLPTSDESVVRLGQQDSYKFRNIVIVLTLVGVTATMFFHLLLKSQLLDDKTISRTMSKHHAENGTSECEESPKRRSWVGTSLLLRVALLYVASRLFITLATVYLPLYIEETNISGKQALATVPLTSYLASFVAALGLKYINRSCGTKTTVKEAERLRRSRSKSVRETVEQFLPQDRSEVSDRVKVYLRQLHLGLRTFCYLLGALIGIVAATVTEFAGNNESVVYSVAILIGAASSITMVTALTVTAELIGPRTENSALVYSIVTFLDKIVTGIVVIFIEKWRCTEKEICPNYNRDTMSLVCVSSMLLGLVTLMSVARCLT